ncbi:MAG: hypothetical protein ACHWZW_11145 [Spirulina sp.]
MFEAKALTGEKAGEIIYAKDPRLTHELCKLWKIYCPECTQFLYFSKSKNPDKRRSYFGHHDYEDKRCPERSFAVNQGNQSKSLAESHEQDLETAESFIEQVFYEIDPEYFQNLKQKNNDEESQQITDLIHWFKVSLLHDCKKWIRYYCETTGFLDWNNPEKEASYLMDWLHVLARKEDLLHKISHYFSSEKFATKKNVNLAQEKFGIASQRIDDLSLTWIAAINEILERVINLTKNEFSLSKFRFLSEKIFIDQKIPPNDRKTQFRGKIHHALIKSVFPVTVRKGKGFHDWIIFDMQYPNYFCYRRCLTNGGKDASKNTNPIKNDQEVLRVQNRWISNKLTNRDTHKDNDLNFSQDDAMVLYIDDDGDLSVKGFIEKECSKFLIKGISKILFNASNYSMLVFLGKKLISQKIAEKAAQLALRFEHGNLEPTEALKKFRELS